MASSYDIESSGLTCPAGITCPKSLSEEVGRSSSFAQYFRLSFSLHELVSKYRILTPC